MEFGWINLIGAIIVTLILIPNIVYALRNNSPDDQPHNTVMILLEQIGRYSCIIFMWLPLLVWKFEFKSIAAMSLYLGGNTLLVVLYYIFWRLYFKHGGNFNAIVLSVIPTCIFLLSGFLLRHWLLMISAVLFGIGHIYITAKSNTLQ